MSYKQITHSQPENLSSSEQASGSPFVVGRPLRADEPIFGREAAFRFVCAELAGFSSVNIIGERRMGKTSLINHLLGNQEKHFSPQPDKPPLALAHIDLQRGMANASRFYAAALRELLARLPASLLAQRRSLASLRKRLDKKPEAGYDEFEQALREINSLGQAGMRPVIVLDEFERLLEPSAKGGFPYPEFFNGLRSIIGDRDKLLAMIVASRRSLAEHFSDPAQPGSLTSTFPNYFQPFALGPLDSAAAKELLLQESDFTLTLAEAETARQWAKGHPCHLQVAGAALYQAKLGGHSQKWADERREELKGQSCLVGPSTKDSAIAGHVLKRRSRPALRYLKMIFWNAPLNIGKVVQKIGINIHDVAAWLIGVVLVVLVILLVFGVASPGEVWAWMKGKLGLSGGGH